MSRVDDLLAYLNGGIPVTDRSCVVCAGLSGHPVIEGDSAPVCWPCLIRCTRAADRPDELTWGERDLLLIMHGDVIRLDERFGKAVWRWTGWAA